MSNETISRDALEKKIRIWSNGYWTSGKKSLKIYDPVYSIPTADEVAEFLVSVKQSIDSEGINNTNIWDCDQHSRYVWVEAGKYASKLKFSYKWPLGMVSGYFNFPDGSRGAHTCNWVYMVEGFALIEPLDFSFHDIVYIVEKSIKFFIV